MFPSNSIICPSCGQPTKHSHWNDGSTSSTQPRLLHDLDNILYLVSAVYRCENKHSLLAHDETILSSFPAPNLIPFVLLKRTGVTTSLAEMCTSFIIRGLNFHAMESLISDRRMITFARIVDTLRNHEILTLGSPTSCIEFWSTELAQSPSDFILKQCFVAAFFRNELLYKRELTAISVGSAISFDHTFKIAANIGYTREDGKWIKQYDALFVVMNGDGKIVTWQLTRGTAFSEINTILQNLKERCPSLETVYIDDCCKLRNKIHTLLGSHVLVKLDVFHAVQRITRTLSAKCKLHHQCITDLSLVFRADGDSNKKRLCSTPQPDAMISKINKFIDKWEHVKDTQGVNVFTSETAHAVANLKKHITKGCLSDIPPGGGTNTNERFHHHVNSILHRSKIGILLAYALLSVVIHSYNSTHTVKSRSVSEPISCSKFRGEALASTPLHPVGIIPKECQQTNDSSVHWEDDVIVSIVDLDTAKTIFTISFQKLQILRSISAMGLEMLTHNVKNFTSYEHRQSLEKSPGLTSMVVDQLQPNGLKLYSILGDGNCFFSAIAQNIRNDPDRWHSALSNLGISDINIDLPAVLRQTFVNELLGSRRQEYVEFLEPLVVNYEESVKCFLHDSFYDSPIGNAMPLAIATALQCSIVIFLADASEHPRYVSPINVQSTATAFLVYNPTGSGHYDAALLIHNTSLSASVTKSMSCGCGSNKKTVKLSSSSCTDSPFYRSRCKCLKNKQPCTSLCYCCQCENPHGKRQKVQLSATSQPARRINRKHHFQLEMPKSKKFAEDKQEALSKGCWSDFESIVLSEIVSKKTAKEHTPVSDTAKLYNEIYDYSQTSYCIVELPSNVVFKQKTEREIQYKLLYENARVFPL